MPTFAQRPGAERSQSEPPSRWRGGDGAGSRVPAQKGGSRAPRRLTPARNEANGGGMANAVSIGEDWTCNLWRPCRHAAGAGTKPIPMEGPSAAVSHRGLGQTPLVADDRAACRRRTKPCREDSAQRQDDARCRASRRTLSVEFRTGFPRSSWRARDWRPCRFPGWARPTWRPARQGSARPGRGGS